MGALLCWLLWLTGAAWAQEIEAEIVGGPPVERTDERTSAAEDQVDSEAEPATDSQAESAPALKGAGTLEPTPEVPAEAPALDPAVDESAWRRVRLIWFGNTGGVSGLAARSDAHERLFEFVGDGLDALVPKGEGPRAFAHEGRILFRPGGLPGPLLRRLLNGLGGLKPGDEAAPRREKVSDTFPMLVGPFEEIFEHPPEAETPVLALLDGRLPGATRVTGRLWRYILADGDTVWMAERPEVDPESPLATDALDWEVRFLWEGEATPPGGAAPRRVFKVDRPLNDGARRVAAVQRLRAEAGADSLVLAAGNDLESFSFVETGAADLQRPNTWAAWSHMGLDLLAPGASELAFGAATLKREAEGAAVTVATATLRDLPFAPWSLRALGPVQVLLVGLSDATLAASGGPAARDPADAVRDAVVAARAQLGRHPDLVVGIGVLSPTARAELVTQRTALDLLLADFEDRGVAPELVRTELGGADVEALRRRANQPLSVVSSGRHRLGLADVWLAPAGNRWRVRRVESQAIPVLPTEPADRSVSRAVQAVRQDAYARAQRRLLPDLGPLIDADPALHAIFRSDPLVRRGGRFGWQVPGRLTVALWRMLVASALRARLDAELVVLPPVPFPWPLAGPVSRLQAAANLNVPDTLVRVSLSAAKLKALARSPVLAELVTAGLDASKPDAPKVSGRDVVDRERYDLVTTAALRADARYAPYLGDPMRPAGKVDAEGRGVALRDAAVDALAEAEGDGARLTHWMAGRVSVPSRWIVDVRELSLGGSNYGTYGPRDPYVGVRETRVTTGSNITTMVRADLNLRREGEALDWLNRARVDFAKANYDEGDDQETADQLILDTEIRFRALAFGAHADITPYTTVQFATEFTPTTREDEVSGATVDNPRKARLEGAFGLVYKPGIVDEIRLAGLVGQDFAERDDDPQVGLMLGLKLDRDFEVARWKNEIDARYYIPGVGVDSATELGGVLRARTSLDLPVFAGVGIGVFIDVFGYLGTSASSREPGASVISGAQLTFDRLFKIGQGW